MGLSKSFTVELKDLYPDQHWTVATVFYDQEELCPQPLRDEYGREWSLKELSIYDLNLIEKHLVQHLLADESFRPEWSLYGRV